MKAFPRQPIYYAETKTVDKQDGMDLRDYFAAKAMQAVVSAAQAAEIGTDNGAITEDTHRVARCAYAVADAMMEARK